MLTVNGKDYFENRCIDSSMRRDLSLRIAALLNATTNPYSSVMNGSPIHDLKIGSSSV